MWPEMVVPGRHHVPGRAAGSGLEFTVLGDQEFEEQL